MSRHQITPKFQLEARENRSSSTHFSYCNPSLPPVFKAGCHSAPAAHTQLVQPLFAQEECDMSHHIPQSHFLSVSVSARTAPRPVKGASGVLTAKPLKPAAPPASVADPACLAAARARTSAAQLEHMVALRRSGLSLRQIGRKVGRCMEGVRQALMRYEQARDLVPEPSATTQDDWCDPLREPEPLPPGHPIAMRGLWHGLEHWREMV